MVSPFPPARDGIASYAVQSVQALRAQGHEVEVLSPGPSAAHHHLDLVGPRGAAALAKRARAYDLVVVQFHPEFFYPLPHRDWAWARESLALGVALRAAREVHVVVHEIDYLKSRPRSPERPAGRWLWKAADKIFVHTDAERDDFLSSYKVKPDRVVVTHHGSDFARATTYDRASARQSLGIPADEHLFLSIGFLQHHKGFDRALRAFRGLGGLGARLAVVGSARLDDKATVAYVEDLKDLADRTPGAEVRVGFVSDELFDRWIVASDTVVLPYRAIWSSSVVERAALYDRPVIVTDVGGLAEQVAGREGVTVVADDDELAEAMSLRLKGTSPARPSSSWPHPDEPDLRAKVQAEVIARAGGPGRSLRGSDHGRPGNRVVSAPLRRLPEVELPDVASSSTLAGIVKRVVRKLTAWQVDPLVTQLNALQAATVDALERSVEAAERPDASD